MISPEQIAGEEPLPDGHTIAGVPMELRVVFDQRNNIIATGFRRDVMAADKADSPHEHAAFRFCDAFLVIGGPAVSGLCAHVAAGYQKNKRRAWATAETTADHAAAMHNDQTQTTEAPTMTTSEANQLDQIMADLTKITDIHGIPKPLGELVEAYGYFPPDTYPVDEPEEELSVPVFVGRCWPQNLDLSPGADLWWFWRMHDGSVQVREHLSEGLPTVYLDDESFAAAHREIEATQS